jgi:hypothetical protein
VRRGGSGIDLIAEPWAIGGNSYQVGGFPSGWAEWNGKFRDALRKKQNQLGVETVLTAQLASRFAGSSDLYQDDGRKPWHSVNFMVAHDGFTLRDLYAYNSKQNTQPWPYGPSDGGEDHNHSWDQAGIGADQRKAARTGLAFMMLSAGVPMITVATSSAHAVRQQQRLQPRLGRQLAGLDPGTPTPPTIRPSASADRLPQGASRPAPRNFYSASTPMAMSWSSCAGSSQMARGRHGLLHQSQSTTRSPGASTAPSLATARAPSTWPTTAGRQRELQPAVARCGQELVPRHRHGDLE